MNIANFGDHNHGFQAGTINGPVNPTFNLPPARPETPPEPSIVIPFGRDRDFVERGSILEDLEGRCAASDSWTALIGLGGVGKSQLAIEHAYRTREQSPQTWVLWAHASNAARLEQSYRDIADRLKLAKRHDTDANIFKLVYDWMCGSKERWLLILDNLDDAGFLFETLSTGTDKRLREYIPHCERGSVLITTRNTQAVVNLVDSRETIPLEPMSADQAQILLQKKLGEAQRDDDAVAELAQALEYMPLAIAQAAAYISQRAPLSSVSNYLEKYQKSERARTSLLNRDEGQQLRRDKEAKNSIITTWQISFEYIHQTRQSAADLLSLMSFFDRQGIPSSLLRDSVEVDDKPIQISIDNASREDMDCQNKRDDGLGNEIREALPDDSDHDSTSSSEDDDRRKDAFLDDVRTLLGFRFISVDKDGTSFEMHALVQLATHTWLKAKNRLTRWKHQFISNLDTAFPSSREYEHWSTCQLLFAHAKAALEQRPEDESMLIRWASLLYRAAWYAGKFGNFTEAEQLAVASMDTRQDVLGSNHEDTWWAMATVASVYLRNGQWSSAEKLQKQVMEKRLAKLGPEHRDTLGSMNDLAVTYCTQGRWAEAEKLQVQVLEKSRAQSESDDLMLLFRMGNLANTFMKQGRWNDAELLHLNVLEVMKAKLGADHPDTLQSMGNLAVTYKNQGRWDEAEKLQVEVLKSYRTRLSADHPDTLVSMGNLASTYRYQGQLDKAMKLEVEVLESYRKKLGANHPDTLQSMGNLATTYYRQERMDEAEKLEVEVLEARRTKLGADHPLTLLSMANLADTWRSLGRNAEATALMQQCVQQSQRVLRDEHPHLVSNRQTLSIWEAEDSTQLADSTETAVGAETAKN